MAEGARNVPSSSSVLPMSSLGTSDDLLSADSGASKRTLSTTGFHRDGDANALVGGAAATIVLAGSARIHEATSAAPAQPAFWTSALPVTRACSSVCGRSQSCVVPDKIRFLIKE